LLCISRTAIAVGNSTFGGGKVGIYVDQIQCVGSEQNIGGCKIDLYGDSHCDHTEDAGVICNSG